MDFIFAVAANSIPLFRFAFTLRHRSRRFSLATALTITHGECGIMSRSIAKLNMRRIVASVKRGHIWTRSDPVP
ncbi:MAG: hypothetical protein A3E85_03020 [Gammaproteobacteria bacterium RIFCSPHIGHO2_12_FULL_45_12]|nr:MAG: hypothetical protein A3E85_03020 [Gammaproteobacteria bacterium RIFCSPHIGHO2_12_FULL_45_12]